ETDMFTEPAKDSPLTKGESSHRTWLTAESVTTNASSESLQVLTQPLQECLVPPLGVCRLQHPMAFVRKIKHLGRDAKTLQVSEKLKPFANGNPEVQLAVDHKHRRLEIFRELVRRPLFKGLSICPGCPLEFPFVKP